MNLQPYLLEDIVNPQDLEINDEFWLMPWIEYYPSTKMMKELVKIATATKTISDLNF